MTTSKNNKLTDAQIGEIIFMALSDDVSFNSINERFGIDSDLIKRIMKQNIHHQFKYLVLHGKLLVHLLKWKE